ncbi:hypothetical protein DFR48_10740 [Ciceribacter lividus]|uniref:Uncharacterized protein n=1 Tax=Ciceribacter lividus TaxID=1197950 RepID=A0A6I7HM89_9HYPH|nr:hypothetical protein [Ciceribacter lividus]RCW23171.1 hypothetical protein DFR48_10740 [Ciceribacter lividus]
MNLKLQFMGWKPDADVCGEAAGMAFGKRVLDLVVTYCGDGSFFWEVVDDDLTDARIAFGTVTSAAEARRAAETAVRRAFIRAA